MTQAVALAGGIDPVLANNTAHILRLDEHGKPLNIAANLSRVMSQEEKDIPLKENDVVVVGESSLKKALFVFKELLPGATSGAYRFAN